MYGGKVIVKAEFQVPYTPYAEQKETGSDQLENEASWAW